MYSSVEVVGIRELLPLEYINIDLSLNITNSSIFSLLSLVIKDDTGLRLRPAGLPRKYLRRSWTDPRCPGPRLPNLNLDTFSIISIVCVWPSYSSGKLYCWHI